MGAFAGGRSVNEGRDGLNRVPAGATLIPQARRATAAWGQGATPPCRRRRLHEEPWYTTDVRFVELALRTQPLRSRNPRGLVRGHAARCPRLDTPSFRHLSTARPPAGKGQEKTQAPSALPHQGALDPVRPVLGDHQLANAPRRISRRPPAMARRPASPSAAPPRRCGPRSSTPRGRPGGAATGSRHVFLKARSPRRRSPRIVQRTRIGPGEGNGLVPTVQCSTWNGELR